MRNSRLVDVTIIIMLIAAMSVFVVVAKIAPQNMFLAVIISVLTLIVCVVILSWSITYYSESRAREKEIERRGEFIKEIPCNAAFDNYSLDGHLLFYEKGMCFADDKIIDEEVAIELVDFEFYESIIWVLYSTEVVAVKYHNNQTVWYSSNNRLRMKALYEWLINHGVPEKVIEIELPDDMTI